jgi:hypothetical protein
MQRLGCGLDDRGSILSRGNNWIFSLRHRIQNGTVNSPGVKRPGREANHSHLMSRLRMPVAIPSHAQCVFMVWFLIEQEMYVFMVWCLVKQKGKFTFTFVR